ncbi:MAG: heavy metal translocating P-type ATPase [Clostridia bacterium]|nr:heavy metal translocating P-type ATPase [Clostridia bacterium]
MKNFTVGGMSCAACSARVEKAVGSLEGVESCSVNLLTSSMAVEGTASDEKIIEAVVRAGYSAAVKGAQAKPSEDEDALRDKETPKLLKRLIASLVFLLILMYFSMGHMLSLPLPSALSQNAAAVGLIQLLLSTAVLVINQKFFISGTRALLLRAPNMDTLVALGSAASYGYSVYGLFGMLFDEKNASVYLHDLYFESAAMILVLITVGKTLESLAKGRTTNAIKGLMKLSPRAATVLRDGKEVEIPTDEVVIGDVFTLRPGDSIPVDGEVIDGESAVDESTLTGESLPSEKSVGAKVFAATINKSGYLKCRATSVGEGTAIAGIIKMVSDAAATKAPIAKIADKVSGVFVPFVLVAAVLTGAVWLILDKSVGFSLARAVSVLVISCPCALGLATPVAIMVGSGVGAKKGILFKNATALEVSGKVKNIVLDKTGTITEGHPRVTEMSTFGVTEDELLRLSASLEAYSEHPLAIAVREYAEEKGISVFPPEGFEAVAGGGVRARVGTEELIGGSLKFISEKITVPEEALSVYEKYAAEGKTPIFFAKGERLVGIIAVRDTVKPDSRAAIAEMRRMGVKVTVLTGDNELSARAIAAEVGADSVIAGVLPDGKERVIRELSKEGAVMMVGDGINDAPALTRADVGVAIGRGTDVAIDSADVVLTRSTLSDVVAAVKLGRGVLRNIKQNLFWAFCYNIVGIPLAAGAFISLFGWQMNPMFGAAAMSLSSFLVVTNALRLNFIRLGYRERISVREPEVLSSASDTQTAQTRIFSVKGMMCPHCEARVKAAIEELDGVSEVSADHKTGQVCVNCDAFVKDADIISEIENAGYKTVD